jgi:hypothetical protein
MIGPSKAVLSKGKILEADVKSDTDQQGTTKQPDKAPAEPSTNSDKDNECFTRSYSILEAFSNMHLVYEAPDSIEISDDLASALKNLPGGNKQDRQDEKGNKQDKSDEKGNKQDKPDEKGNSKDSGDNKDSNDKDDSADIKIGEFKQGEIYEFRVGIEPEGYTQWKVAIDSRADIKAVKNAIRAKKFKTAYQIASKDTKSDGLVPLSATTYINKKPPIYPAFIGHCRYGFDSGSMDGPEDNLTICLAVAPINAKTNKPSEDTVIKAVYNVVGDITGGVLGNLAATITQKVRDAADGKSSRYDRDYDNDDKDSEKNASEELSKFLNKKFRCVGDHTMYDEFLSIRKFIKSHLGDNTLELKSVTVGNDSSSKPLSAAACKEVYKNKLVYF